MVPESAATCGCGVTIRDLESRTPMSSNSSRGGTHCVMISGDRLPLQPRVRRNPVRLPGLAAVVGERLLESNRVGRERRDDEADQDGASVERILAVELAAPVLELAEDR